MYIIKGSIAEGFEKFEPYIRFLTDSELESLSKGEVGFTEKRLSQLRQLRSQYDKEIKKRFNKAYQGQ